MSRVRIYPYKMGSKSAKMLSEGLRGAGMRSLRVRPDGRYRPRPTDVIINWGASRYPQWWGSGTVLNNPGDVMAASDKLMAFQIMSEGGVSVPDFTTDMYIASQWYRDGHRVVGRAKLNGHSGEGIYLSDPVDYPAAEGGMDVAHMSEVEYGLNNFRPLPLYVKYIKKKEEYRVHVFRGQVIDIQQKRKRREVDNEDVDYKVRSHNNGWVFCRGGVEAPDSVVDNAIRAVNALQLDFGAVDVIWNQRQGQAYVLEINTAPGLEGETVVKYVNSILEVIRNG